MNASASDLTDSILSRPIEALAPPPRMTAVKSLASKLHDRGLSEQAAMAVATSVEDPAAFRRSLERPSVARVPGGSLLVVEGHRIRASAASPYPVNPRVTGVTPYPVAREHRDAGTAKFSSLRDLQVTEGYTAELTLTAPSRAFVRDALQECFESIRAQNNLEESVKQLGVLMPVTVVPLTIETDDEPDSPVTIIVTPEGSSRMTAVHRVLEYQPADTIYGKIAERRTAAAELSKLAEIPSKPLSEVTDDELARARAVMVPATVVVGFEPDAGVEIDFLEGISRYLALWHISPPKEWSEPAKDNVMGDDALAELHRDGFISSDDELSFLMGGLSGEEARELGFSTDMDERAARILRFFTKGGEVEEAVKRGMRRRSFISRIHASRRSAVAASVALRGTYDGDTGRRDRARPAMEYAFRGAPFSDQSWSVTGRDPEDLRDRAIEELNKGGAGAAAVELAALGGYALIASDALWRGGTGQVDGRRDVREPNAILRALANSERGIEVLAHAVAEFRDGQIPPRRIDDAGEIERSADGGFATMSNEYIRLLVPSAPTGGETGGSGMPSPGPEQEFEDKLRKFEAQITCLEELHDLLSGIEKDGSKLVETKGIDGPRADDIAKRLDDLASNVKMAGVTWRAFNRPPATTSESNGAEC